MSYRTVAHHALTVYYDGDADLARKLLDLYRRAVLREAIEAARCEYLTDDTGTDDDTAYQNGVSDAIAAIGALTEGGEAP